MVTFEVKYLEAPHMEKQYLPLIHGNNQKVEDLETQDVLTCKIKTTYKRFWEFSLNLDLESNATELVSVIMLYEAQMCEDVSSVLLQYGSSHGWT